MIYKIVLDTNVLVSSLLREGPPAAIVNLAADGTLIPFYNELILGEYWDVLRRPKFGFTPMQVHRLIDAIVRIGVAIKPETTKSIPMQDEDDRVFYDTAKESAAYLITGNIKHFPKETFILNPADFLQRYYSGER